MLWVSRRGQASYRLAMPLTEKLGLSLRGKASFKADGPLKEKQSSERVAGVSKRGCVLRAAPAPQGLSDTQDNEVLIWHTVYNGGRGRRGTGHSARCMVVYTVKWRWRHSLVLASVGTLWY